MFRRLTKSDDDPRILIELQLQPCQLEHTINRTSFLNVTLASTVILTPGYIGKVSIRTSESPIVETTFKSQAFSRISEDMLTCFDEHSQSIANGQLLKIACSYTRDGTNTSTLSKYASSLEEAKTIIHDFFPGTLKQPTMATATNT